MNHRRQSIGLMGLILLMMASSTQAAFLTLAPRPVAMGGAFVGLADDLNAVRWNPAGLANQAGLQLGGAMDLSPSLEDMSHINVAGTFQITKQQGLGINASFIQYEPYDRIVIGAGGLPEVSGSVTPSLTTTTLGYGHTIIPGLAIGAKLNYFHQTFDDDIYNEACLGVSALYQIPESPLSAGLLINNLIDIGLSDNTQYFTEIQAGVAAKLFRKLTLLVDLATSDMSIDDYGIRFHGGAEYKVIPMLALRAGYRSVLLVESIHSNYPSLGVGVNISVISVNYAVSFVDADDMRHQVSVVGRF